MDKPLEVKEISFDYIIDYIKGKGKADVAWLKELVNKQVADKKSDQMRNISFVEIRNEFARKYMPEIVRPPKETKPTMKERLAKI
ncbi:MAG: hypothetical protein FWG34_12825 [Oscillospiraceae bacterium]|nr:hypothetical protein [Oscillospiraceae bacterium]